MNDNCLNCLTHLHRNRDIALNYDDVIDEFGKTKHRLQFKSLKFHSDNLFKLCALFVDPKDNFKNKTQLSELITLDLLSIIDHVPVSVPTIRPSYVDLRSVIKNI